MSRFEDLGMMALSRGSSPSVRVAGDLPIPIFSWPAAVIAGIVIIGGAYAWSEFSTTRDREKGYYLVGYEGGRLKAAMGPFPNVEVAQKASKQWISPSGTQYIWEDVKLQYRDVSPIGKMSSVSMPKADAGVPYADEPPPGASQAEYDAWEQARPATVVGSTAWIRARQAAQKG